MVWRGAGFFLAWFAVGVAPSLATDPAVDRTSLQEEGRLIVDLMQNMHVTGRAFRDIGGAEILKLYLDQLDPEHLFLTANEIETLSIRYQRTLKSVYLMKGDATPAKDLHALVTKRADARLKWLRSLLEKPLPDRPEEVFKDLEKPVANDRELNEFWERKVLDATLRWELAGLKREAAQRKVLLQFEEGVERYRTTPDSEIRAAFFDAAMRTFDAHSGYFSPDTAREASARLSGFSSGVGLRLEKQKNHLVIASVIPGSPADVEGSFGPGDRVEQAFDETGQVLADGQASLLTWDRVLNGKTGTRVKLVGVTPRGPVATVLVAEELVVPADLAYATTISLASEPGEARRRALVLRWPSFYTRDDQKRGYSLEADLRELLSAAGPVDLVVADVRDNPGGSLPEAVAAVGLFLPQVTAVRIGHPNGKTDALPTMGSPAWTGPLAVLVSAHSASASELFSAAMQHHKRSWIIGPPHTFGKGTVQQYMDLNRSALHANRATEWGTARVTTDLFLRPDGRPIQRVGVASDLVVPWPGYSEENLEEAIPYALEPKAFSVSDEPGVITDLRGPTTILERERANIATRAEGWDYAYRLVEVSDASKRENGDTLAFGSRLKVLREQVTSWLELREQGSKFIAHSPLAIDRLRLSRVEEKHGLHRNLAFERVRTSGRPLLRRNWYACYVASDGQVQEQDLRKSQFIAWAPLAQKCSGLWAVRGIEKATDIDAAALMQQLDLLEDWSDAELAGLAGDLGIAASDTPTFFEAIDALLMAGLVADEPMRRNREKVDLPLLAALRLHAWPVPLNTPPSP